MAIRFFNSNIKFNLKNKRIIKDWIKSVISYNKKSVGDINYIFTSEDEILEINNKYLNHNFYTDIITFPYVKEKKISADIYICIDIVQSNANEFNQKFHKELCRVIVHGILHMVGYDDQNKKEQQEMRKAENFLLNKLNESLLHAKKI